MAPSRDPRDRIRVLLAVPLRRFRSARALLAALLAGRLLLGIPGSVLAGPDDLAKALGRARRAARPLDLSFRDADVKDVLRVLAEAGRIDLVIADGVEGRVTVRFTHARWADAVLAVLRSEGLGGTFDGRILFVDTLARLAETDRIRAARRAASAERAPLVTRIIPVRHARAEALRPLVESLLSDRGRVLVDERTNVLVVTDAADAVTGVRDALRTKAP